MRFYYGKKEKPPQQGTGKNRHNSYRVRHYGRLELGDDGTDMGERSRTGRCDSRIHHRRCDHTHDRADIWRAYCCASSCRRRIRIRLQGYGKPGCVDSRLDNVHGIYRCGSLGGHRACDGDELHVPSSSGGPVVGGGRISGAHVMGTCRYAGRSDHHSPEFFRSQAGCTVPGDGDGGDDDNRSFHIFWRCSIREC